MQATQGDLDELVGALNEAGVFELIDEPYDRGSDYSVRLDIRGAGQDKRFHFHSRPTDGPRLAVHRIIMDFADRMKVALPADVTAFTRVSEGDHQRVRDVSIAALIADPAAYDGKRVSIVGYRIDEFEGRRICIDKAAAEADDYDRCLWYDETSSFANPDDLKGSDQAMQRTDGVFRKGPAGHFGMWPGAIERITRTQPAEAKGN